MGAIETYFPAGVRQWESVTWGMDAGPSLGLSHWESGCGGPSLGNRHWGSECNGLSAEVWRRESVAVSHTVILK